MSLSLTLLRNIVINATLAPNRSLLCMVRVLLPRRTIGTVSWAMSVGVWIRVYYVVSLIMANVSDETKWRIAFSLDSPEQGISTRKNFTPIIFYDWFLSLIRSQNNYHAMYVDRNIIILLIIIYVWSDCDLQTTPNVKCHLNNCNII